MSKWSKCNNNKRNRHNSNKGEEDDFPHVYLYGWMFTSGQNVLWRVISMVYKLRVVKCVPSYL